MQRAKVLKDVSAALRQTDDYCLIKVDPDKGLIRLIDNHGERATVVVQAGATGSKSKRKRQGKMNTLIARDGQKCWYCGDPLELDEITFDHVIPKSEGGSDRNENLRLSCFPCNNEKGGVHGEGAHPRLVGLPSAAGTKIGELAEAREAV